MYILLEIILGMKFQTHVILRSLWVSSRTWGGATGKVVSEEISEKKWVPKKDK